MVLNIRLFIILNQEKIIFKTLKKPGLLLQNITTREPDDKMLEVSIAAIKDAFRDEYEDFRGRQFTAEAIE